VAPEAAPAGDESTPPVSPPPGGESQPPQS
jgi:hypothetical protein